MLLLKIELIVMLRGEMGDYAALHSFNGGFLLVETNTRSSPIGRHNRKFPGQRTSSSKVSSKALIVKCVFEEAEHGEGLLRNSRGGEECQRG